MPKKVKELTDDLLKCTQKIHAQQAVINDYEKSERVNEDQLKELLDLLRQEQAKGRSLKLQLDQIEREAQETPGRAQAAGGNQAADGAHAAGQAQAAGGNQAAGGAQAAGGEDPGEPEGSSEEEEDGEEVEVGEIFDDFEDDMGENQQNPQRGRVPDFYGEGKEDLSPNLWIETINNMGGALNWDAERKLFNAKMALKGSAGSWKESQQDRMTQWFDTWDHFVEAFKERFGAATTAAEAVRLSTNLRQKPDEDVKKFFDRVHLSVKTAYKESLRAQREVYMAAHVGANQAANVAMCMSSCNDTIMLVVKNNLISGFKESIRQEIEKNLSDFGNDVDAIVKKAVEIEASRARETPRQHAQLLEVQQQNQLVQNEMAALHLSTGGRQGLGRGSRGGNPRGFQRNRGRGGANPGGFSNSSPGFGNVSHKQRVALRNKWLHCFKCKQWGKHYARECIVKPENLRTPADSGREPNGVPRDSYFDQFAKN